MRATMPDLSGLPAGGTTAGAIVLTAIDRSDAGGGPAIALQAAQEGSMNAHTIRRTPWTCRFGRFGVTVEQLGPETLSIGPHGGTQADDARRVRGVFFLGSVAAMRRRVLIQPPSGE